MKVLVACEESQRVTIELRKLGNEAYSCDLLDCSGNHPEWHIKKDVTLLLNGVEHEISGKWDMIIAFSPCTYLTVTGNRWFNYEKWCAETWKRYEAIINPEWHHVNLATLANIDFDMLDKKRQVYLKAHRELKRTLLDLSKCKTGHTYEARARKFMRDMISKYYDNEISYAMRKYLDLQLSMSNVVNGVWSSYVEPAMGLHESRRYSRPTLTY